MRKIAKIKKDSFWNNLFKNSFWAFLGETSASVIGLIVSVVLINNIGAEEYGILVLAQSYMLIMDVLINVQSWKSVIQYGQDCIVKQKIDELNSYIKLGTLLDLGTALLCTIIAYFFTLIIGQLLCWSTELILCAQLFSLTILSHFSGTPTAILRLYNKFHLVALQKFIGAAIKLVVLLLMIGGWGNIGLVAATIAYCVTDVINNILLIVFAAIVYRKKNGLKNIIFAKMPKSSSGFIGFTIWGTVSEAVDIPVNYFDVFLVSLLGNTYVSIFKVFKQCIGVLQKVSSPIQQSILPQFSELAAKNEATNGYKIVIKIHHMMLLIIMPFSIIIGLLSPLWLKVFYGDVFAIEWPILLAYLIVQTYALSYTAIHPYFLSLNQPKRSALYVFLANIVYMALAFFLVVNIGMIGMVLAYLVQCCIVIWLKIAYINRNISEERNDALRQ